MILADNQVKPFMDDSMKNVQQPKSSTYPWSLVAATAFIAAGWAALLWSQRRKGSLSEGVDDLIDLCESFADRLERSVLRESSALAG